MLSTRTPYILSVIAAVSLLLPSGCSRQEKPVHPKTTVSQADKEKLAEDNQRLREKLDELEGKVQSMEQATPPVKPCEPVVAPVPVPPAPVVVPAPPSVPSRQQEPTVTNPMSLVTSSPKISGLRAWSIETLGARGEIGAAQLSPDGKSYATAGTDGAIRLFDPKDGRLARILVNPEVSVTSLCWAPDNRRLAVGTEGGAMTLWDVPNGRIIPNSIPAVSDAVVRMAWSPDGNTLAVCRRGNPVILCGVGSGNTQGTVLTSGEPHKCIAWDVAWSPDSTRLVTASRHGPVCVWEVTTPGKLHSLQTPDAQEPQAGAVAWAPNGKQIATRYSGKARIWDATSLAFVSEYEMKGDDNEPLAWSPDSRLLVGGAWGGGSVIEAGTGRKRQQLSPVQYGDHAVNPGWVDGGDRLVYSMRAGHVISTKARSDERVWMTGAPPAGRLGSISPDGQHFVTVSNQQLSVWEWQNGRFNLSCHKVPGDIRSATWSQNGWIAVGGTGGLTMWKADGSLPLKTVAIPDYTNCTLWSPGGDALALGISNGSVQVWVPEKEERPREIMRAKSPCVRLAWAPDGSRLAVGFDNGDIAAVHIRPTSSQTAFKDPVRDPVAGLAWMTDGRVGVINRNHGAVCIYNPETGEQLERRPELRVFVHNACYSSATGVCVLACSKGVVLYDPATGVSQEPLGVSECWGTSCSGDGQTILATYRDKHEVWHTNKLQFSFLVWNDKEYLSVAPNGKWQGPPGIEGKIVYLGLTDEGRQLTFTPAEFAAKYGDQYVPGIQKP